MAAVRNVEPTYWIDLDMLPFGRIGHPGEPCTSSGPGCPRMTRFTSSEQQSIFTLWNMVQAPLIIGADLTVADPTTLALLNNLDIMYMSRDIDMAWESLRLNTTSSGMIVWQATSKANPSTSYIALFNLKEASLLYTVTWVTLGLAPSASSTLKDLWAGTSVPITQPALQTTLAPHGCLLVQLNL